LVSSTADDVGAVSGSGNSNSSSSRARGVAASTQQLPVETAP